MEGVDTERARYCSAPAEAERAGRRQQCHRFDFLGARPFFCSLGIRACAKAGLRSAPGKAVVGIASRAAAFVRFGLCDIGPHQFDSVPSPHTFGRCGRS